MIKYLKNLCVIVLILLIFNITLTCLSISNTVVNIIALVALFIVIPFIYYLWKK